MKKLYLFAVTLLLSFTIVMAQEKQEKIGDTPQLKKVSKQAVGDQTSGAIKVNSTTAVVTYDFTDSPTKYYGGTDACVDLSGTGAGPWAMIAGDADGSGVVDAADRSITWNERNQTGYLGSDLNMSGVTEAGDRSKAWNNRNKFTRVPN